MFAGNIDDKRFAAGCPPVIQQMLEILGRTKLANEENGKYLLDDGMFYVLMDYDTARIMDVRPEAHEKYIDVQVVLRGKESMGWSPLSSHSSVLIPYNEEKDICYYQLPAVYNLIASPARACNIFFPNDIHAPGMVYHLGDEGPEPVRKVVGKIPVHLVC
ncbi:MAG: YhcH/YjgK/YiaL family protein [Spirochaetota bacterium]